MKLVRRESEVLVGESGIEICLDPNESLFKCVRPSHRRALHRDPPGIPSTYSAICS